MSNYSINKYEVAVDRASVDGYWVVKIYRTNDPETDFSVPVSDFYLGESDSTNAGINSPFRMNAVDFEARYRSILGSSVWGVFLKYCPDFPGG